MNTTHANSQATRRLMTERKKLVTEGPEIGFYACPTNDILLWHIFIRGSDSSLYEHKILHATMKFPADYPMSPPTMIFLSEMFHPNIYEHGGVCISTLKRPGSDPTEYNKPEEMWTPVQSIRTVVLSVISMLNEPNCESPANLDASSEYLKRREEYERKVRRIADKISVKREDMEKIEEIKENYNKELAGKCLWDWKP